jgi:uncharacterized metal-binding protein YceD (DUF177 family)
LKISLDELRALPQQRLDLSFNEKLEGTAAVKPVVGDLSVGASATGMRLTGRVQTMLKLECDRCLRTYFQPIVVDIDEHFIIGGFAGQWEKEPEPDRELRKDSDFVETLPPDNVLDISDIVYQAVTLATPTVSTCGSECPGPAMPAKSAKNASLGKAKDARRGDAPIDPRWKNLKTLFPNED